VAQPPSAVHLPLDAAMTAIFWLAAIAAAYASTAWWLALIVEALRHRRLRAAVALLIPAGLAAVIWLLAPLGRPFIMLAAAVPVIIWCAVQNRLTDKTRHWKSRRRLKEDSRQVWLHLALVTGAVIFSLPFVWMVSTSLKTDVRIMAIPPEWIPQPLRWINYARALQFLPPETRGGLMYLWNTVYVSLLSIIGVAFSASLVAYGFARLRWPGRDIIFVILLATMMLPGAVTMIPVFLIFKSLGWVDTLRPLWVPAFTGGAFNVFLLRQFFLTIPRDLEDAAKIDGCSFLGIYWHIMVPQIKPALAAVVILTFMGAWNNFMGPLIYISSPERMPVAYALQLYQSAHATEYNMLMAAATMVVMPVIVIFLLTQRYFIQGVTLTGIKG